MVLTPRQTAQIRATPVNQRPRLIAAFNRQNAFSNVSPYLRTTTALRDNILMLPRNRNQLNRYRANPPLYSFIPRGISNPQNVNYLPVSATRVNTLRGRDSIYPNGGNLVSNDTINRNTNAPTANGFSLTNSGERNVTFAKEYVGAFLNLNGTSKQFTAFQLSSHPATNSTTGSICRMYQRYKILSYAFKYKASCPTTTTGMHYTGVDYGNQIKIPANFREAESLEHFSVGPIWEDSQTWHILKQANMRERWFSTNMNSEDPESRPARIIFGAVGANAPEETSLLGAIEVRVTYLFNGLGQNFTADPDPFVKEDEVTEQDVGQRVEVIH